MVEVFKYVDKFLTSLNNYLNYNSIFLIAVGLFLFTTFCILISTSNAYEAKLIKVIDKLNVYFYNSPHITEDNLVAFNAKMKSSSVPKQLRKEWQQFVLYREAKASEYMSFENCVTNPLKTSSYKRDVKLFNYISWIIIGMSLTLNCFYAFETDFATVLRNVLLCPLVILILKMMVSAFLHMKHSAIINDIYQNYPYFEINIDKATETIPEYVDYEVLFDKNEIKKGIPILYQYLQKRAEEEQRELERARLKNVEHEKFNFDDQGIAASLVLERAMQEAENYIAERKKYNQDINQINSDITQEDLNYREITKEYNRQMQVSKETFDNFKTQLAEASSTIEANYLKKQQQQELDRQRNLERDFDTATEKHKRIIEQYQAELDTIDAFIAESRKALEDAMKSEFKTYSSKVYDEAEKLIQEREQEKFTNLKKEIQTLEEKLITTGDELQSAYSENQELNNRLSLINESIEAYNQAPVYEDLPSEYETEEVAYEDAEQVEDVESVDEVETIEKFDEVTEPEETLFEEMEEAKSPVIYEEDDVVYEEPVVYQEDINSSAVQSDESNADVAPVSKRGRPKKSVDTSEAKPAGKRGRPRKEIAEVVEENKPKRGRPRKVVEPNKEEEVVTTKKRGRPRKVQPEIETVKPEAKKRGRPRKIVEETKEVEVAPKKRGRPRKEIAEVVEENKPKRGRPRKVVESNKEEIVTTKKRGRPRKVQPEIETVKPEAKKRGRPRKIETVEENKPKRGRPRKVVEETKEVEVAPKKRGRPRKEEISTDLRDIDTYLKQIDAAIARENARIEETKKELAKKTKISKRKK